MKRIYQLLTAVSITFLAPLASGEVAIVVGPDSPVSSTNLEEVTKIFLGKAKKFADGSAAVPLDQAEGETAREEFYTKVVKKTPSQLNAYWSRLIFTGKGQPPQAVEDDSEVMELVAEEEGMVGYIDASSVDGSVKVILTIP